MRRFIIFSLLICCFSLQAQYQLNTILKTKMHMNLLPAQFNVVVHGNIQGIISHERELGIKVKYSYNDMASVSINQNAISKLIGLKLVKHIEYIEPRNRTMNDTAVLRNRIKPVKLGQSPLTMAYDGTGVIMGIIDSGCDFNHPDFKDALGNTRIQFLWDQAIASPTNIPMPFGYGQEWTAAQINSGQCTHNDLPYYGHGTHVSGIAAGNGLGNGKYQGMAPKTELVVVALGFNLAGPTIADAVQYIINKATAAGKPFVINASVGDYYGSHDGTNSEAKLIDAMIGGIPGRAMVAAAGNAGNVKFHTKNIVIPADTNFTWITSPYGMLECFMYADTADIKNVKWSIGVNRPGNYKDLGRIGFKSYNYGMSAAINDTIKFGGNQIGYMVSSSSINAYGVYELYVRIQADSLNYLWRMESNGTGKFHSWNFDFKSTALPTTVQYPKITKYTMPDTVSSMVSSFQCSDQIIVVANYVNLNKYYDVTNTLQTTTEITGNMADNSSCGPTRDNRLKPDVAATGSSVFSCGVISMMPGLISGAPSVVATGSLHVLGGGTSAASPVVAGLAALYMQKNPTSTNMMVKQAITNCTYNDVFTGSSLPNYKWGYGKLDGFSTFTCAVVTGIDQVNNNNDASIYPNPFSDVSTIKLAETINGIIEIYNTQGQLIIEEKIDSDTYHVKKSELKSNGIYFVKVNSRDKHYNFKLVAIE